MRLRLAGHPIHPLLVHFPVALWTLAVVMDVIGWISPQREWWLASFGSQLVGVATGAVAMIAGFIDYAGLERGHEAQDAAVMHMMAMCSAWLLFVMSLALRGWPPLAPPSIWATVVAVAGFAVVCWGGWLGGQLVYRFGVGVERSQ